MYKNNNIIMTNMFIMKNHKNSISLQEFDSYYYAFLLTVFKMMSLCFHMMIIINTAIYYLLIVLNYHLLLQF